MSRRPQMTLSIEGMDELIASLAQFGSKTTAKRLMRGAMNKAAQSLVVAARKNAPAETRALRKAMTRKVITKGFSMTAVVGPDAAKSGPAPEPGRKRVPRNYSHLVEFGFVTHGQHVPGSRFMERTAEQRGPKAQEVFIREVGVRIEKELAKGRS